MPGSRSHWFNIFIDHLKERTFPSLFAVETRNLSKRYGKTDALRGLNFTVNEGEIMVILGPNGSGKTTLLMILCTILKPTSGTARVVGIDVVDDGQRFERLWE